MLRLVPKGRLGNQLIQYAAVRAQARRLSVELEIDLFHYEDAPADPSYRFWLETLPIRARLVRHPAKRSLPGLVSRGCFSYLRPLFWHRYRQPEWAEDPGFFAIEPWTVVSGYFQSPYYLPPRDDPILCELDLASAAPPEARALAQSLAADNTVSLHVRRGDAVRRQGDNDRALPVWQAGYLSYLEAAMRLIREQTGRPRFLIFSDDIAWCQGSGSFGADCEFVEPDRFGANPAIDLLLMSACRHHIVANSTYSWWAAWLAADPQRICIVPRQWTPAFETEALGLVCPGWVVLG